MNRRDKCSADPDEPDYRPTLIESECVLSSLLRQLRNRMGYFAGPMAGAMVANPQPATRRSGTLQDTWNDYPRHPASWVNSLMVHALVLTALILPFIGKHAPDASKSARDVWKDGPLYVPIQLLANLRGGGGGGTHSPLPASKGPIPRFSEMPLAPPSATIPNLKPLLAVEPNLLGPPDLVLPEMNLKGIWGDPNGVTGPYSNGPGKNGGIGGEDGTGVGHRKGPGYGPGPGGPGGVYSVGSGVRAPVPIYKPEPPYSEEARKSKYQGSVELWIVVDGQGNVADVRVAKPLGMGLDEKAVETVRTWKFQPAVRNGAPVPVRVMVEVVFRLF